MKPNRARRALPVLIAVAVGLTAGACSDDAPSGSGKAAEAGTVARIKVFAFVPDPLKVPSGTKVTWVNDDDIAHTVTSGKRTYEPGDTGKVVSTEKDGAFDIELAGKGAEATHTFNGPGTFHYFCDRHPGMEAEVVVS